MANRRSTPIWLWPPPISTMSLSTGCAVSFIRSRSWLSRRSGRTGRETRRSGCSVYAGAFTAGQQLLLAIQHIPNTGQLARSHGPWPVVAFDKINGVEKVAAVLLALGHQPGQAVGPQIFKRHHHFQLQRHGITGLEPFVGFDDATEPAQFIDTGLNLLFAEQS